MIPRICNHVYARTYRRCTCHVGVHIRGVHAEDQPPDPFRRCIYRCSLFSRCRFLFFSFPRFLSFILSGFSLPLVACPAARRPSTYPSVSYTTGRLGTVLVTTFPGRSFGKRRIFSCSLPLFCSRSPARSSFSLASNFTVLLCMSLQRKGLDRGELPCRIQRGNRRETGDGKGLAKKKRDREGKREMIIHSAVITQSPAP